jgi:hypothetical protein
MVMRLVEAIGKNIILHHHEKEHSRSYLTCMFPNKEHENSIFLYQFSFGSFNVTSVSVQISDKI